LFVLSLLTRNRGYWPIARYFMYCVKSEAMPTTRETLFGIREGSLAEENLLSRANLKAFFSPMIYRPGDVLHLMGVRGTVEERLHGLLELYERRRAAGRHHGPRYVGVRLYEVKVASSLAPAAHDDPERVRLLAEYFPAATATKGSVDGAK